MKNLVDLHLHSTYSDGVRTPEELVTSAADIGLKAIAIADHDTVDGIDEAIAKGKGVGIEVIPAIEFSVEYGKFHDVHLLGYLLEYRDPELLEILKVFRDRRERRGEAIVERINEKLKTEAREPVSAREAAQLASGALGRPHIAQILMKKGYVTDMQDAFDRYLVPCDVPKRYFPMQEAIATIRRLGGVAVLAHPVTIARERGALEQIIDSLIPLGLDGLEAYNNICGEAESIFLQGAAQKRGMIWTGGSDFHGIEEGISIGSGRGSMRVPYFCVEELYRIKGSR